MRISRLFYQTMKEVPQQLASGIYNYLPLARKSLVKIETIIREEMEKKGCQEVLLPMVQPADLWEKSGRWSYYGPELLRMKDRKNNDFCLGPTHEKQLPWNLFQIQDKFRDEVRPRFGLMRGREFLMKDGYSFDVDEEAAKVSYRKMYDAYTAIFKRCGLEFRAVDAATGNIGGDMSHEFQVLAQSGEDLILSCDRCDYAANGEKAVTPRGVAQAPRSNAPMEDVYTPDSRTIEEISAFLGRKEEDFIKSLVYMVDEEPVLVLIRGDLDINESKLQSLCGANGLFLADDSVVLEITGAGTGFDMVCGANRDDYHKLNVNYGRDYEADVLGDLAFAAAGDACPHCEGHLEEHRGIEVGQVFYLGTRLWAATGLVWAGPWRRRLSRITMMTG